MIDMHSHIIPMVDDGSKSFLITEEMLKVAKSIGFNGIFATPHYMDRRSVKREEMLTHFNKVKELALSFGIELFLGNEVFICPEIANLVSDGVVSCLNNSKYLLIEFPRNNDVNYIDDVIFELGSFGIVPILAHPERYRFIREDIESVFELADKGILFQLNSGSLIGDYGEEVKKTAKKLLKYNAYQFMGSDAHSYDRYMVYNEAKKIVSKISGDEILKLITDVNPTKVKNNEEVTSDLRQIKKSFLFWR